MNYFETNSNVTRFGTPVAIYAMARSHPDHGSLRPIETVTPLSSALGITLNTNYQKDDYQAMANAIMSNPKYMGKMVLICWEHTVIPQIVQAFGYKTGPQNWDGDAYFDRTWVLNFSNGRPVGFNDYIQHVLPTDQ